MTAERIEIQSTFNKQLQGIGTHRMEHPMNTQVFLKLTETRAHSESLGSHFKAIIEFELRFYKEIEHPLVIEMDCTIYRVPHFLLDLANRRSPPQTNGESTSNL